MLSYPMRDTLTAVPVTATPLSARTSAAAIFGLSLSLWAGLALLTLRLIS